MILYLHEMWAKLAWQGCCRAGDGWALPADSYSRSSSSSRARSTSAYATPSAPAFAPFPLPRPLLPMSLLPRRLPLPLSSWLLCHSRFRSNGGL
jgi:hypothetical protein